MKQLLCLAMLLASVGAASAAEGSTSHNAFSRWPNATQEGARIIHEVAGTHEFLDAVVGATDHHAHLRAEAQKKHTAELWKERTEKAKVWGKYVLGAVVGVGVVGALAREVWVRTHQSNK